jgi:hypothetical protein
MFFDIYRAVMPLQLPPRWTEWQCNRDPVDPGQPFGHISKETRAWVAEQPRTALRIPYATTPGLALLRASCRGLLLARFVLRQIGDECKQETQGSRHGRMDYFNRSLVVHTSSFWLDKAA